MSAPHGRRGSSTHSRLGPVLPAAIGSELEAEDSGGCAGLADDELAIRPEDVLDAAPLGVPSTSSGAKRVRFYEGEIPGNHAGFLRVEPARACAGHAKRTRL
jgi:hypothetical protein